MAHTNDSTKEQQPNTNESTQKQLTMDKKLDEMLEPKERVNPRLLVQYNSSTLKHTNDDNTNANGDNKHVPSTNTDATAATNTSTHMIASGTCASEALLATPLSFINWGGCCTMP